MEGTHPLKAWRDREGLTQEQAAVRLGVPEPALSRYERGRRSPSPKRAVTLSKITGIPAKELRPDIAELLEGEAAQ